MDDLGSAVRDVTPPDLKAEMTLLFLPCEPHGDDQTLSERYCAVASDEERSRACRMVKLRDRVRFLRGRAFRRYCAAQALGPTRARSSVQFAQTTKGRPYLPELPEVWFSFSGSETGHLAAWSGTHAVGVDIEDDARASSALELARHYFSVAEADAVSRTEPEVRGRTFLRLWTLKEAALKSVGEGLPYGLDAFQFEMTPTLRVVRAPAGFGGPGGMHARLIELRGADGALILRERLSTWV
ncbi:MAG: 4'-phosphopantetheinyl transferase superfamily protein [Hyphomicrobiaceae bacterium]